VDEDAAAGGWMLRSTGSHGAQRLATNKVGDEPFREKTSSGGTGTGKPERQKRRQTEALTVFTLPACGGEMGRGLLPVRLQHDQ
jgi:hypothetical protein